MILFVPCTKGLTPPPLELVSLDTSGKQFVLWFCQTKIHHRELIMTLIIFVVNFKIKAMCGFIKLILEVKIHL